ncbi:MAG: DUF2243 domain-containing protein [Chthoniobacteraceae bacterium]
MKPVIKAGVVLGLGLGGFFDGIVFHQILGWHHMVCTTATCQPTSIEHLKRQNTQDGFFHLAVWILTVLGIVLLSHAGQRHAGLSNGKTLTGAMVAGWGAFNFCEGLVDHQILGLHHVLPGSPHQLLFDLLFLASGILLFVAGWKIVNAER